MQKQRRLLLGSVVRMHYKTVVVIMTVNLLASTVQAIVWDPEGKGASCRGKQLTPGMVEYSMDRQEYSVLRTKRNTEVSEVEFSEIGYTSVLSGDGHSQALVRWSDYPSDVVFILTRKRTGPTSYASSDQSWLWRSVDHGHTFVNETYKWDNDSVVEWYYVSPLSEYLIFVDQLHNKLYVTRDEGETYTTHQVDFHVDNMKFQSNDAEHSKDPPYNEYVLAYDERNQSLWVSTNLGKDWRKLANQVVADRYYWRQMVDTEGLGAVYFEKASNDTHSELYFVRDVADVHQEPEIFDTTLGSFLRRTFVLKKEYMLVQVNYSSLNQRVYGSPLWVSHNRKSFRQATFPFQLEEKHYSVIDASEGRVFIAVYHSSNSTNLYVSDAEGLNYSFSLDDVVSPADESSWVGGSAPDIEVHVVEGVVGTYIANKRISSARYDTSVISFDKGGKWLHITPPAVDKDGNPIVCVPPECSLHLRLDPSPPQSIFSRESAVGLLMAHGNIGSSVSRYGRDISLYFSRDGGFTWFEVATGSWNFGFAALGSIVVTVPRQANTNTIRWSCTEGRMWKEAVFTSDMSGIRIAGMITQRSTRYALAFGAMSFPFSGWLVVSLNFSSVVPDQCSPDDYFQWSPSDERLDDRCVLGETITYERRNSTTCCYIDPQYELPISRTPCECTIEDFECDFGFERLNLDSPCTPLPWLDWPPSPPDDCVDGATYNISSGYRKITGDKCILGQETYFFEQIRHCPIFPPGQLSISYTATHPHPLENITFQLTQSQGGKLTTWYAWSFNDSSPIINTTGYNSSSLQVHSFNLPGVYVVSVIAVNAGGSASISSLITVLDVVGSVSIIPPAQIVEGGLVPAGVELMFGVSLATVYGTLDTGEVGYSWGFGDGTVSQTHDHHVSHIYQSDGMFNVTLSVTSLSQTLTTSYQLNVYRSATHVRIVSDDVVEGGWVISGLTSNFTVLVAEGSTGIVPPDTSFSWHITHSDKLIFDVGSGPAFSYSFPVNGHYELNVYGAHFAGSFSSQLTLTAEYYIDGVEIRSIPTVRRQHPATVTIEAHSSGIPYVGHLIYRISGEDGQNLTGLERVESYNGSIKANVLYEMISQTESVDKTVVVHVENHVSKAVANQSMTIIVKEDYGRIRLVISTAKLPPNFGTALWLSMLRNSIKHHISVQCRISSDQVEVESIQFIGANHTKAERRSRSSLMYVNINILPSSINSDNIAHAKNVSSWLVLQVKKGTIALTADNSSLAFEAELRGPPSGLSLSYNSPLIYPTRQVAFQLKQSKVGLLTTWYLWDFNDTTPENNITGYKLASSRSHVFHKPGEYTISVFASNDEGSSEVFLQITVFDVVSGVSVLFPIQMSATASNTSVPTGIQLVYTAVISTTYGTLSLAPVVYLWDFGDGTTRETSNVVVSHSYNYADTYLLTLSVRTPYSPSHTSSYLLSAYKSATHVRIVSIDNNVTGEWITANVTTTFTVEIASNLSEVIPPDTYYSWNIVSKNGLIPTTQEGDNSHISYSFSLHGHYNVFVYGNHSAGSFSAQLTLHAEYYIDSVEVNHACTVRVGSNVAIIVMAKSNGQPYIGQLSYRIFGEDLVQPISGGSIDGYSGEAEVSFVPQADTIVSVETKFMIHVENHVSSTLADLPITVVVQGDYGCVGLMFDGASLPWKLNSTHWMTVLKTSLVQLISSIYSINETHIEIGRMEWMKNEAMYAEINFLPLSLKLIGRVRNISKTFISDVNSGLVGIIVNGTKLSAAAEQCSRSPTALVTGHIAETKGAANLKLYSATGGGLGLMFILSVAILTLSIILICYYHKRYKHLQMRYSRLNQTPARIVVKQDDILEGGFCVEPDDLPLVNIATNK